MREGPRVEGGNEGESYGLSLVLLPRLSVFLLLHLILVPVLLDLLMRFRSLVVYHMLLCFDQGPCVRFVMGPRRG